MFSLLRSGSSGFQALAVAVVAAAAGGCSADIARFDFPATNLAEPSTGTIPTPTESVGGPYSLGGDAAAAPVASAPYASAPPYSDERRIDVSALPPPAQPAPAPRAYVPPAPVAQFAAAPVAPEERGEEIEVQRGDTLYGLSKRHSVSLNELMRVNGLTSPVLRPGQKLALPSGKVAARAPAPPRPAVVEAVPAPADWTGTYTVKAGDSLYAVARQNRVRLDDLQRYNGIADVRRVKPGVVLKIPGVAGAALAEAPATGTPPSALTPPASAPVTAVVAPLGASPTGPSATPTILNAPRPADETRVAALETTTRTDMNAATAPPASGSVAEAGRLRWPVRGRVIAGYGPRTDGTHNDGINISVPMGTDIHAAENGSVAYAGSELKGYGNLILVRHDSGLVTAYAHASEIVVKRGDRVARGQVIGRAGKTGQVDQPQLHFEVRQGQKPVDPALYLEKL